LTSFTAGLATLRNISLGTVAVVLGWRRWR
jgi:hypothetical protein